MMKIAFCNRPNYDCPLGGDAVQMICTKEKLESIYGIEIQIVTNPNHIDCTFDIVHVFNFITYEVTSGYIKRAKQLNIPIVSSSIYWDYSYAATDVFGKIFGFDNFISRSSVELKRRVVNVLTSICPKPTGVSSVFKKHVRQFIDDSCIIAPNSEEEGNLLLRFADRLNCINKIRVVYNGVDFSDKGVQLSHEIFFSKYKIPEDFILQVGRIEYLKNQINLVYSLMEYPEIPIVFIGKIFQKQYYLKLKKISQKRGNVYFLDQVPHDEINNFYRYARVHVLLSLRESPGLVSLEALSLGCPIVTSTSEFLPVKTYFNDNRYVADPFNVESIKKNVIAAYREGFVASFNKQLFSWDNIAKQTYDIYSEILKKHK